MIKNYGTEVHYTLRICQQLKVAASEAIIDGPRVLSCTEGLKPFV